MFEYLMPLLVMPTYENTLLDQTYKAAVDRQIEYGRQRGVPWGISESGYNAVDAQLNYQYRAFGVPGLGLKRGLAEDLVIAPYASALALMVAPEEACVNLRAALAGKASTGTYGFYEAIDYTPSRVPRGQLHVIVRSFMAHHQGMSLLSLAYLLLDRPMQKRFESDPLFQATMLLLQERVPRAMATYSRIAEVSDLPAGDGAEASMRVIRHPDTPSPEVQLLVQRPLPRDGHQRRRRLQPLARPGRHALARRRHPRQLGHLLLHPRRCRRKSSGRAAFQPTLEPSR